MSTEGHGNGMAGAMVHSPERPSLAKTQPAESRAFEPTGIAEAFHLAGILVKSRLLPDSVTTPEAAFAIIATGRELGLTAMQSLRSIHVVKGRTILSADLVAALVKSRPDVCKYFQLVESTAERAVYRTHRVGDPEPTTMAFTMEDAKRAQVTGNPTWTKYPQAMLRARCITALARAVYPDLAMGIYDPDEFDMQPPVPTTALEVVAPQPEPDLSATLAASVEKNWPVWEKKQEALIKAAQTPQELNEAWTSVTDEKNRLKPPAGVYQRLAAVKAEHKKTLPAPAEGDAA